MGAQLRAVRRRIRSVQSTAKITRAQELIASSRIIKAQQRLHDAQPYAREITRAVEAVVSRRHVLLDGLLLHFRRIDRLGRLFLDQQLAAPGLEAAAEMLDGVLERGDRIFG